MPEETDPPVYILSDGKLKPQGKPQSPAPPQEKYLLGSPLLSGSLALALLIYYLDAGSWRSSAERYLARKEARAALEPYRLWAQSHPLDYDEVAANPAGWLGRAVLWDIRPGPADVPCYAGDPAKKVAWAGVPPEKLSQGKVLARIESADSATPVLAFLGSF